MSTYKKGVQFIEFWKLYLSIPELKVKIQKKKLQKQFFFKNENVSLRVSEVLWPSLDCSSDRPVLKL